MSVSGKSARAYCMDALPQVNETSVLSLPVSTRRSKHLVHYITASLALISTLDFSHFRLTGVRKDLAHIAVFTMLHFYSNFPVSMQIVPLWFRTDLYGSASHHLHWMEARQEDQEVQVYCIVIR